MTTDHFVALVRNPLVFWGLLTIILLVFGAFNASNMLAVVFVAHLQDGSFDEVNDGAFLEMRTDPDLERFWTAIDFHLQYVVKLVNGFLGMLGFMLVAARIMGRKPRAGPPGPETADHSR
jgi:hypothetical protein